MKLNKHYGVIAQISGLYGPKKRWGHAEQGRPSELARMRRA